MTKIHCLTQAGGIDYYLSFVQANSKLYYGADYSAALAALFGIPVVLALYVSLNRINKGVTLIGSTIGLASLVLILAAIPSQFYLINEAVIYDGGCTVCAQQATTGAISTFQSATASTFATYVLAAAIVIVSLVIIKGNVFSKGLGYFGIAVVLVSVVAGFINISYASDVPAIVEAIWLFAVGYSLVRLPSAKRVLQVQP